MKRQNISRLVFSHEEMKMMQELLLKTNNKFENGAVVDMWILDYRRTQDPATLDKILGQVLRYIIFLAKKYKTPSIDVRDLIVEAVINVIEVIKVHYKVSGHQKFITYIKTVVERRVKDYCDTVNQAVKLPKNIKSQQGKLKARGVKDGIIYSKINIQFVGHLSVLSSGINTVTEADVDKKLDAESLNYDIMRVLDTVLTSTEKYIIMYTFGIKYNIEKSRGLLARDLKMSVKDVEAAKQLALKKLHENEKAKDILIKYINKLND